MPASFNESSLPIQESIKSSLAKAGATTSLDQRLVSNSKQILMHKIEFRPAEKASNSYQLDSLRAKYTPLNAGSGKCSSPELVEDYKAQESTKMIGESLPVPKVVLFPAEKIQLEWPKVRPAGAGLVNLGNTCFLNSTLQCLSYTAPMVNYLNLTDHSNSCKLVGFCMLCELHKHIKRCEHPGSIKPLSIVHKLRVIAKHMHLGRQEDAHEFLRYVIDHMQKSCLHGYSKLDNISKETTAINQIFGGYLRSQVVCLRCHSRSNTYDPFLDISLDIKNVPSVEKALERYIHPERLDSDNAYNCTKCKQKVPAQKCFTIHKAPNVLTIQLKRFDCSRPSAKVTRHVQFPEKLDLRPYMSYKGEMSVTYQLYAVLVHSGYSCNSGHYYCFVKAPNRIWHCMNDEHVGQTGVNRVLNAEAYLLFYRRHAVPQPTPKGPLIGPQLPKATTAQVTSSFTSSISKPLHPMGNLSTDLGIPISHKPLIKTSTIVSEGQIEGRAPVSIPTVISSAQREKISFGIKPKDKEEKPRLVMRIKHGTVCYNSIEDRKSAGDHSTVKPKLVPYNGESDSESENEKTKMSNGKEHVNGKVHANHNGVSPVKKSSFEPVIDKQLTTTTTVPGAYVPLDKASSWQQNKKNHFSKDDTHNYQPVNKAKPFRRSLSDEVLRIDTNPVRVNATTHWSILGNDAQASPSVASESSSSSVNSTTEWHVKNTPRSERLVANAQHQGWKVTPLKPDENHTSPDVSCTPTGKTETMTKQVSSISLPPDLNHTVGQETGHKLKPSVSLSALDKPKKKNVLSRFFCLGSSTNSPGVSTEPLIKEKPYDLSVYDFHDEDVSTLPKHGSKPSEVYHDQKAKVELDDISIQKSQKKHKKHKKHKKKHKRHHGDGEEIVNGNDSTICHKKKKKKHKKRRHEDEEADIMVKKRKTSVDTEEDTSNDQEYAWVEKSVDTLETSKPAAKPVSRPEVHVQYWDSSGKSSQKRSSVSVESSKYSSKSCSDSGRTTDIGSDAISELLKGSSHVMSWDGGRSTLEDDDSRSRYRDNKRSWSEEYEEELDRGKVKKVRCRPDSTGEQNGNAFQGFQDSRNIDNDRRKSGSGSQDDRHRGYDFNGNHHKPNYGRHDHSRHRDNHYRNNHGHHNRAYYNHH